MQDRELYRQILGIESPWKVERVELRRADGEGQALAAIARLRPVVHGAARADKRIRPNVPSRHGRAALLTRIFNLMYDLPTFQRPSASLFIGARSR